MTLHQPFMALDPSEISASVAPCSMSLAHEGRGLVEEAIPFLDPLNVAVR